MGFLIKEENEQKQTNKKRNNGNIHCFDVERYCNEIGLDLEWDLTTTNRKKQKREQNVSDSARDHSS